MRRGVGIDVEVAALAARQGGVVARRQLRERGLSDGAIDNRMRVGRLHAVHRGVLAVGHPLLGPVGRRWAAVLASGEGAVLSDAAAAAALGFRRSAAVRVDVTVPASGRRAQRGIRLHRRLLAAAERTRLDGLPITTAARTLLDLAAGGLRDRSLGAALDRAQQLGVLSFDELPALLERHAGRPGAPALRAALARYTGGDARSALEEVVGRLCATRGLPRPQENVVVAGWVRDFYWPRAGLVVEADSYAWHRSPSALDDDRERDVSLSLAGLRGLRFTYAQATRRPKYVADAIARALASDFSSHTGDESESA